MAYIRFMILVFAWLYAPLVIFPMVHTIDKYFLGRIIPINKEEYNFYIKKINTYKGMLGVYRKIELSLFFIIWLALWFLIVLLLSKYAQIGFGPFSIILFLLLIGPAAHLSYILVLPFFKFKYPPEDIKLLYYSSQILNPQMAIRGYKKTRPPEFGSTLSEFMPTYDIIKFNLFYTVGATIIIVLLLLI